MKNDETLTMTPQCNEPRRVRTNRGRTMKRKTLSLRARIARVLMTAALLLLPMREIRAASSAASPPFQRTEVREPCANYVATKQPFFG